MIREATLDDAAGASALFRVVNPEFVSTEASFRHFMTADPLESRRRWWCAVRDGAVIGWASMGLVVGTSEEGVAWLAITVHPEHRRRGIGSELAARATEHARTLSVRKVAAWSRSDGTTVGFARSHGYEQTGTEDILTVDPRTIARPEIPAVVELRPFRDFEDDPTPIYDVDRVAAVDEPGEITYDDVQYDHWRAFFWSHPLLDRDASMLAAVDGTPAAVTFILIDREHGRATNNGTCTLPDYRGRGLAMLAKRASLTRAAELGVTAVYTGNDATNAPMQAINRKLGYTPCATMLSWSKTFTP